MKALDLSRSAVQGRPTLHTRRPTSCLHIASPRVVPTRTHTPQQRREVHVVQAQQGGGPSGTQQRPSSSSSKLASTPGTESGFDWGEFTQSELPKKLGILLALVLFSRVGVYVRLPGVDVDAFAESMAAGGLLGTIDALSGGSISRVGVFSLGIVPYINASIMLQLLATAFPSLKKLQREEGPQGRARFQLYQKMAALAFAVVQAIGQLTFIRPYVEDYSTLWFTASTLQLVAGAMILIYVADTISELKLGNGTSILIFAGIASALPTSVGQALTMAADQGDNASLVVYFAAVFLTTMGIVYVQEAERKIPINYASRYRAGSLARQSYLPFKVNATGVMPVIFSTSLLAAPVALARFTDNPAIQTAAAQLTNPAGPFYLPLEPTDVAEQLKRSGASIPGIRPGRATADYITQTLSRMSILGSAFLGVLAAAPALVEGFTGLQAFRGFAGTSVLILVGVATDTARRVRAELAMSKYKDIDTAYDDLKL